MRSPRHLTDTQKNALALSLKGEQPAKIKIIPFVSAPDASEYAAEFGAIFRAAGWEVEIDNALFLDGDKTGMWLTVKDEQIPAVAQIVYNALIAAGIPMRDGAYGDGNVPAGDVWLKIGLIK